MRKFFFILASLAFTFTQVFATEESENTENTENTDEKYLVIEMNNGLVYRYVVGDIKDINFNLSGTSDDPLNQDLGVDISGIKGAYTYVDLGLPSGTLWATTNIGAVKPEKSGEFFAWGETEFWENSKWQTEENGSPWSKYKFYINNGEGVDPGISKYNSTDNLHVLESEDDAATAKWGSDWRMPTPAELTELQENCESQWYDDWNGTGVPGVVLTSKINQKTMFLPAAGRFDVSQKSYEGYSANLWASSNLGLYDSSIFDNYSAVYYIWANGASGDNYLYRNYSCNIRAVVK